MTMFTGLGGDKKSNAVLMKELYDQAHGPNATPAMKAEYAKAQEAWTAKHSTGPFDPSKFATGAKAGSVNSAMSMDEKTKALFPTSHAAGFILIAPNVSANGDWKPTPSQKKGPLMYTSNAGYTGMNEQLRGAKIHGYDENGKYTVIGTHPPLGYPAGTQWDQYIKSSDEAFAAVPPLDKDIVTHRVMEGYKPFDAFPPPMTPGAEYTDQGYGSTTKGKSPFYGDFHMEIQIPKGRRVLDLNHTTGSKFADSSEQEILLNRGTKFRIISDTKVGNTRKVVVQVVDDGHQVDNGGLL
jgi:hypothetical protein